MEMYANEVETKEKEKLPDKKLTITIYLLVPKVFSLSALFLLYRKIFYLQTVWASSCADT